MPTQSLPTVSRVLPDGTLIELVHDDVERATALAVGKPDGSAELVDRFELPGGEVLAPYAADNNLLTAGCVMLPSTVGPHGSKAELLADIRTFLHRYVDLTPLFELIAAHYVLFSWVFDAFSEAPMLRLAGDFGSGKTRALLAIGSLCHKAFFASGASTVSPIFHILDAFGGTLALDEADLRFSDATADLVKILNNGTTRGLPVLRTMTNRHRELNPAAFRVFGPKILAMRGSFNDEALESRFITEAMGCRPLRPGIPLTTPDALRGEAQQLRNRLLAWRFAVRLTVEIDPMRAVDGLSTRGNQMALPLLSLVDDAEVRQAIGARLLDEEARAKARRASQPQAKIAHIVHQLLISANVPSVPVAKVAEEYNRAEGTSLPVKSVGHIVRKQLGLNTRKSAGVYVIPVGERAKIATLFLKSVMG
jgi:hypothetical protein